MTHSWLLLEENRQFKHKWLAWNDFSGKCLNDICIFRVDHFHLKWIEKQIYADLFTMVPTAVKHVHTKNADLFMTLISTLPKSHKTLMWFVRFTQQRDFAQEDWHADLHKIISMKTETIANKIGLMPMRLIQWIKWQQVKTILFSFRNIFISILCFSFVHKC